jgi:hypothetical protein
MLAMLPLPIAVNDLPAAIAGLKKAIQIESEALTRRYRQSQSDPLPVKSCRRQILSAQ